MNKVSNFNFVPTAISAAGVRLGKGPDIKMSMAIMQRTIALRAYSNYTKAADWMDKLSNAYVVALATRSADTLVMQSIQNSIPEDPPFQCTKCRELTIGPHVIRRQLFPKLKELREHANALIHHLDDPGNRSVAELNIQGIYDYCYHLFEQNADLLFGEAPLASFTFAACKKCRVKKRNIVIIDSAPTT